MTEHNEEHLELCAALALGNISPADREQLAQHLGDGCLECEAALGDFEQATVLLASSLPPAMPRPEVRDKLLTRAASGEGRVVGVTKGHAGAADGAPRGTSRSMDAPGGKVIPISRFPFPMPSWGWMAVAAGFAVTTLIFALWAMNLTGQVKKFRGELLANSQVVEGLNKQLEDERRWAQVLQNPDARYTTLSSTPSADAVMRGRATFDPKTQNAVIVFENLRAPKGKVFELWAITDGPTSLGIIQTDRNGRGVMRLEKAGDPERLVAFAVSLENPGGSPNPNQPSGPVVLLGRL